MKKVIRKSDQKSELGRKRSKMIEYLIRKVIENDRKSESLFKWPKKRLMKRWWNFTWGCWNCGGGGGGGILANRFRSSTTAGSSNWWLTDDGAWLFWATAAFSFGFALLAFAWAALTFHWFNFVSFKYTIFDQKMPISDPEFSVDKKAVSSLNWFERLKNFQNFRKRDFFGPFILLECLWVAF